MAIEIILGAPFFDIEEARKHYGANFAPTSPPEALYSDFGQTKIIVYPMVIGNEKYFNAIARDNMGTLFAAAMGSTKEKAVQTMIGKLVIKLKEQAKIEQIVKECYECFTLPEGSNPQASILNLLASEKNL